MTSVELRLEVRPAIEADLPVLRALYRDAVLGVGRTAYSAEQVDVWVNFSAEAGFEGFILSADTYVALKQGAIVAFCGLADEGHLASIYVGRAHQRCGIGLALLNYVLARHPHPSSGRYYTEASEFSRPLFLRAGFHLVGIEKVQRNGVGFERYLMERAPFET
ncbi:MAG: GNAT family N-acetyltransferase [Chromatiales bacterium]|nr:GNAT family N-acetyltransferase [Chromatiales bacterium]